MTKPDFSEESWRKMMKPKSELVKRFAKEFGIPVKDVKLVLNKLEDERVEKYMTEHMPEIKKGDIEFTTNLKGLNYLKIGKFSAYLSDEECEEIWHKIGYSMGFTEDCECGSEVMREPTMPWSDLD